MSMAENRPLRTWHSSTWSTHLWAAIAVAGPAGDEARQRSRRMDLRHGRGGVGSSTRGMTRCQDLQVNKTRDNEGGTERENLSADNFVIREGRRLPADVRRQCSPARAYGDETGHSHRRRDMLKYGDRIPSSISGW